MTADTATKPFGRTGHAAAAVWHEHADGHITAGSWTGLVLHADDLDRRGGDRLRQRVASLGRPFEFVVTRDVLANDLKVGWPLHRLQRFRDETLCRWFVIDTSDVLEAEWIAANAPVHGVILAYDATDMAARYRVFSAADNAGVALIGRGDTARAAALQRGTTQLTATLLTPGVLEPAPLPDAAVEALWTAYAATHAEPPKLRGGHPPDDGV